LAGSLAALRQENQQVAVFGRWSDPLQEVAMSRLCQFGPPNRHHTRLFAWVATAVLGVSSGCASEAADPPKANAQADAADTAQDAAADAASEDSGPDAVVAADVLVPNTSDPLGLPLNLIPKGDEFMVAIIPDTQIYAEQFPDTFERHMKWLAQRASAYNIVFVSHVGDIVQTGEKRNEWNNAVAAYDWLRDEGVPHGLAIGSHDFSDTNQYDGPIKPCGGEGQVGCKVQMYVEHFGAALYKDKPWYRGASTSGESSYQIVEASGFKLLFLHLMHDTPQAELQWAGEVLDAHPDALVHLTTHRYMFDYRLTEALPPPLGAVTAGRFNLIAYTVGGQSAGPTTATKLFEDFISTHPNIFMVHCGHVDAEFRMKDLNKAGLPVHQTLVDFQDMADGGGGWLRLLHFKPSENKIEALTVSTETGKLRNNGDGFEHSIGILDYYKKAYAKDLEELGLDMTELDALLTAVKTPGALRDTYFSSLYDAGDRDSRYTLDVDFQAYLDAAK